jgi:serine/threonine protein kinase
MALSVGTKLGRYEIRSQLGAGGMGEVYRARDTQLGRDVAIKVLPSTLYINSDRLQRFEQEACAASALNHPNILVVHDIGANNGAPYIVSELLEGETLRKRLAGTPLGQRRAIDYALQIARGLGAAHEKGIVHRDLKPDNIFITNDGRVKIFDFGLAKLTQADGDQAQTDIPTRRVDTDPGVVMGTVGYMSPEQVRGKAVDHRADIFSFGAILYEMLSGRRAFRGESAADMMSAILKEDPPELSETNKNVSPALERLVNHCLEKNPEARFNSARDLAFALESLAATPTGSHSQAVVIPASTPRLPARRELVAWILAGVGLLATTLAIVVPFLRRAPDTPATIVRYRIPPPEKLNFVGPPTISPDGSRIVVAVRDATGRSNLWIQQRDSVVLHQLNGTEGGVQPFWSPDGHSIGFFAGGKLKRIDAAGGTAQTICDSTVAAGGSWSKDGVMANLKRWWHSSTLAA